jgi:hypothetical protein
LIRTNEANASGFYLSDDLSGTSGSGVSAVEIPGNYAGEDVKSIAPGTR